MWKSVAVTCLTVAMSGCSSLGTSSISNNHISQRETNLAAAHALYNNFLKGDINAVLSGMSDDIVWIIPGDSTLPYSGTKHGKTEWMAYLKGLGAMDIKAFEPKEFLADGNKVVVLGKERLTVKSTGKTFEGEWAQVMTFNGGKLIRFQSYDDTAKAVDSSR